VSGDGAKIGGDRQVRSAIHFADDRSDLFIRKVDDRDPRPSRGEGERYFAADAAGGAGDENALAVEP
jgi:hypothetical protein